MTTPAQKITTPAQTEQDILDFRQAQLKEGKAEETIRSRIQALRQVGRICDINDSEIVKTWLADTKNEHQFSKVCTWSNKTKTKFIDTYSAYLRFTRNTMERTKIHSQKKATIHTHRTRNRPLNSIMRKMQQQYYKPSKKQA